MIETLAEQEERAPGSQPIADFEIEIEAPRSDLEAQRAELDERVLDGSLDAEAATFCVHAFTVDRARELLATATAQAKARGV